MTTLTLSTAPLAMSNATLIQNEWLMPNRIMHTPNPTTLHNSSGPAGRSVGRTAKNPAMINAPTAVDALRIPRPTASVCKMSVAKIGSSAVAPPKSTANKSSKIAPRITFSLRMCAAPANMARKPNPPVAFTVSRGRNCVAAMAKPAHNTVDNANTIHVECVSAIKPPANTGPPIAAH